MNIPSRLLKPLTEPGTTVGLPAVGIGGEIGGGKWKMVACGSHDTASAVAGVPAEMSQPLFLSSGTWSLLGRELLNPMVTEDTCRVGFSNEQGLNGTTRFLKNVAGMWLLQECKRNWDAQGQKPSFGDLVRQAETSRTSMLLDPDAEDFAKPCDMPGAIRRLCGKNGADRAVHPGEYVRVILESLALKYRKLIAQLRLWMPDLPDTLYVVGGGSQNALLNQMAADACGLRVVAGPVGSHRGGQRSRAAHGPGGNFLVGRRSPDRSRFL